MNRREQIMAIVRAQPATAEEVGAELGITTNIACATLSDLRRDGLIARVGRMPRLENGRRPYLYGVGPEFVGAPEPCICKADREKPRHVDPARIAGRAYMRQYAGWGDWR